MGSSVIRSFRYLDIAQAGEADGVARDMPARQHRHGLATEDSRMRYFLNAGGVLVLTFTLVHVGISRTTEPNEAPSIARNLHLSRQPATAPKAETKIVAAENRLANLANRSPNLAPLTKFHLPNLSSNWIGNHAADRTEPHLAARVDLDPRLTPNVVLASVSSVAVASQSGASLSDLADQSAHSKGTFSRSPLLNLTPPGPI